MKKTLLARQFTLTQDKADPDTVWVNQFPEDDFCAEPFTVIQRGIWWWRSFSIARFIPDCGAPASQPGGGWWDDVKSGFKIKAEALAALRTGDFKMRSL